MPLTVLGRPQLLPTLRSLLPFSILLSEAAVEQLNSGRCQLIPIAATCAHSGCSVLAVHIYRSWPWTTADVFTIPTLSREILRRALTGEACSIVDGCARRQASQSGPVATLVCSGSVLKNLSGLLYGHLIEMICTYHGMQSQCGFLLYVHRLLAGYIAVLTSP